MGNNTLASYFRTSISKTLTMKLLNTLTVATTAIIGSASAFAPTINHGFETSLASSTVKDDLMSLAGEQNNVLKYYDPLNLADANFWEEGDAATIGFLRHAEIKHGRVAMAAFVGYCVQSQGIRWPFDMQLDGAKFPAAAVSPEAQWDAVSVNAKWQIFSFIALLEVLGENSCGDLENSPHYMRGGQPGKYPDFEVFPNLYDPFNLFKKMSPELKAKRLNIEVNNGRLAMIGIFGFMAADRVPGAVPFLSPYAQPYDGNIMAPFASDFSIATVFGVGS